MDEKPISVSQIGNEIEIRCGDEARRLPLSFLDSMAADIGSGADAMSGRGIVFQGSSDFFRQCKGVASALS